MNDATGSGTGGSPTVIACVTSSDLPPSSVTVSLTVKVFSLQSPLGQAYVCDGVCTVLVGVPSPKSHSQETTLPSESTDWSVKASGVL